MQGIDWTTMVKELYQTVGELYMESKLSGRKIGELKEENKKQGEELIALKGNSTGTDPK